MRCPGSEEAVKAARYNLLESVFQRLPSIISYVSLSFGPLSSENMHCVSRKVDSLMKVRNEYTLNHVVKTFEMNPYFCIDSPLKAAGAKRYVMFLFRFAWETILK
jgi:hypothetical protein